MCPKECSVQDGKRHPPVVCADGVIAYHCPSVPDDGTSPRRGAGVREGPGAVQLALEAVRLRGAPPAQPRALGRRARLPPSACSVLPAWP
eukprot:scaffold23061_cov116-Isochrysis_galbana.AAC.5